MRSSHTVPLSTSSYSITCSSTHNVCVVSVVSGGCGECGGYGGRSVVRVGCGLDSIAYNVRGLEDVSTYASPSSRLTLQFNAEFGPLGVSVERCS